MATPLQSIVPALGVVTRPVTGHRDGGLRMADRPRQKFELGAGASPSAWALDPSAREVELASVEGGQEASAPTANTDATRLREAHSLETDSLVRRARRGESAAWSRLYSLHVERLYKHLGYLTGDASVAEDLVQEVFASAMVSLDRFDGRSSFSTWLFAIARNAVYKHWRSRARRDRAYKRVADGERHLLASAGRLTELERQRLNEQRALALDAALEELPDKLREAFVLVDLRETPLDEAAEILGITRGNLSVRTCRARARLREVLEARGWMGEPSQTSGPVASGKSGEEGSS